MSACGRCVAVCKDVQGIGAIRMEGEGMKGRVVPSRGATLAESGCVNCGQCILSVLWEHSGNGMIQTVF